MLWRTRFGNAVFASGGARRAARELGVPGPADDRHPVLPDRGGRLADRHPRAGPARRACRSARRAWRGRSTSSSSPSSAAACSPAGYGSAVGASIGALLYAVAREGIALAGWDPPWFQALLGVLLLVALLANGVVALPAEGGAPVVSRSPRPTPAARSPVLELQRLTRPVRQRRTALSRVSATLPAGEITCVLGENGSGKSTLVAVLSGLRRHDEGELLLDGEPVRFRSPQQARAAGIATVWQDLAVAPLLSVWRNFFLGAEPTRGVWPLRRLDLDRAREITVQAMARVGVPGLDPDQPASALQAGRAAEPGDRPRAALRRPGAGRRRADGADDRRPSRRCCCRRSWPPAARGSRSLLVTNNPRYAHLVGDRFLLLAGGQVAGNLTREDVDADDLMRLMAGGEEFSALTAALTDLHPELGRALRPRPGRARASAVRPSRTAGQVKMLTPPGPTSRPTMMSTMPHSICPRKIAKMPAITRMTARIHRRVTMTALPTCAGARSAPCTMLMITRSRFETTWRHLDELAGLRVTRTSCGRNRNPQFLYPVMQVRGRARGRSRAAAGCSAPARRVSPIASAACASTVTQRRKPRLGSCDHGTGPKPFQPLRRSASSPRW